MTEILSSLLAGTLLFDIATAMEHQNNQSIDMTSVVNSSTISGPSPPPEIYLYASSALAFLYGHIICMIVSWVVLLPIVVNLNIVRSNLRYPTLIICLGFHGVGTILGLAYNSKTPDLYPNNSHHRFGWILTVIIITQFVLSLWKSFTDKTKLCSTITPNHEASIAQNIPKSQPDSSPQFGDETCREMKLDQVSGDEEGSIVDNGDYADGDSDALYDIPLLRNKHKEGSAFTEKLFRLRRWSKFPGVQKMTLIIDPVYTTIDRLLIILGFIAICTGIVTATGIFHGKLVFNGLAHFIKGGIFFWIGILTAIRWAGGFAQFGWAWNVRPSSGTSLSNLTMEFIECFTIFLYGIINVFLEHLAGWGEAWVPADFEHVAISLLFIGGGTCGMMVESQRIRQYCNKATARSPVFLRATLRHKSPSINPIPALILFVLGMVMGGHHQNSMESAMMHRQFGNFLAGAAASRSMTYLILLVSPPVTTSPSHPPSELITSFCLMCGGIMLMASNRETVQALENNGINAMLVMTVVMGLVAMIMSWILFIMAVGSWAEQREEKWNAAQAKSC